jgi:hypothetical protein
MLSVSLGVIRQSSASGKIPDAYQVVIRAKFKDQVPIETLYTTHRVLAIPRGGAGKRD